MILDLIWMLCVLVVLVRVAPMFTIPVVMRLVVVALVIAHFIFAASVGF